MLHDLGLNSVSSRAPIIQTENSVAEQAPMLNQSATLTAHIANAATQYSTRPAVWACGETLTYGEFWREAGAIGRGLLQAGVQPGDRVAILSARSVTAYTAILAVLRAGCTYVPLNPRFPLARNRTMLAASQATALIVDRKSAAHYSELLDEPRNNLRLVVCPEPQTTLRSAGLSVIDQADLGREDDEFIWPEPKPEDLAYLLFTSGSTGAPKGAPIRHRSVCDYIKSVSALTPVTSEDRLIQLVDLTFDLSAHDMFLSWSSGASIVSVPENATLIAPRFVQDQEVTGWLSVPSAVGLAHQAGLLEPSALPSLRFSHFCGEALPRSVAEIWSRAAPNSKIYNLYGPTEATIAFSYYQYIPGEAGPPAIPIGRPLKGQDMAIFDQVGRRLSLGETGEIHLAGSQLSPGYWRASHLDAERFVTRDGQRWYRTGDVGRLENDGYHYLGRIDRQTKIRGYRVELLEIEGALRSASGQEVVAAVPWPLLGEGVAEGVVGFVTGGAVHANDIRAQISNSLPDYMVPSRIIFLDEMPLNANDKVDYKALEERLNKLERSGDKDECTRSIKSRVS
jgi:D-alanine--poly(phosphoribitol) ligase subunit 1